MNLINNQPGQPGLTEEGKKAFKLAYESIGIAEANQPIIRFPRQAADIFNEVSKLRMKSWSSTTRWNAAADATGLACEIAAQRYFGFSAEYAMADFLEGLKGGDRGHDLVAGGLKVDIKGTCGDALRFKLSKTNRFAHLADAYLFAYLQASGMEARVFLLGWVHRSEVKPFLRDDGHRYVVRAETIRREGLLKPVSLLKEMQSQSIVSHTVQPVNQ